MQECFGLKPAEPKYLPEPNLNLYGHIDSWYGKAQADIGITVMAHNDSVTVMGSTRADSLGNFVIPLDDFYGKMEALIQTRSVCTATSNLRCADLTGMSSIRSGVSPLIR